MSKDKTPTQAQAEAAERQVSEFFRATVEYPQMREALESLEVLRMASRCNRGRSRGALIYGPSGSGKSTLARCFEANHPRHDTSDRTVIPVLYVELPSQPTAKVIGESILTALNDDYAGVGSAEVKLHRAKKLLAACEVEVVLIDEIQHISDNLDSRSRDVAADTLKNLMNSTGIPFVFIGLPSGAAFFSNRMQLKRRLNPKVELSYFRFVTAAEQDDFGRLLLNFHERLPFQGESALIDSDLTYSLHSASFGLIGSLTLLLEGALRMALRQGTGALTRDHLRDAFSSEIFLGCKPSRNPFHVKFNGLPLVDKDEPYFGLRA
jgi:hypothetical protein